MTIKEAITSYLEHCEFEKNLSSKTLGAYQTDMLQFLTYSNKRGLNEIAMVDRTAIRDFYTSLSRFQPRTVRRKMTCIQAFFKYLEFEDFLNSNPFRKMRMKYNTPTYLPTVLDKSEVSKILKSAYSLKQNNAKDGNQVNGAVIRDIAILEILFATGVRVSELCNLRNSDIDISSGVISIFGKGRKERIVQIVDSEVKLIVAEYAALFVKQIQESGFFFINRLHNQISSQSVRYMVDKYVRMAGIDKKVTPHTFRHTFATLLLEADVDIKYIQHFLGHSSIMTTQIYTHVNKEKQHQILRSKHPRLSFRMND